MALYGATRTDRPTTTVTRAELERLALDPDAVRIVGPDGWSVDVGGERFVAAAGAGVEAS